jgi:hypothetical protein
MSEDFSFLANFITEDLYLIKESELVVTKEQSITDVLPETGSKQPLKAAENSEPVNEETIVQEESPIYIKPLPTEGNNLKHCLIFFESNQTHLEANKKAFLLKILSSVKRSLDDVMLVNLKEASKEQIEAVLSEYNHRHVLVFASGKLDHMVSQQYEVKEEAKKFYLKADDLEKIEATVDLKKALWAGLQKMFL